MISKSYFLFALFVGSFGFPIIRRQPSETFVLPISPEGPGPTFDATATRVATSAQIRNAANPNICFDVSDFRAGDSRFNLVPLALRPCDSANVGQQFDLVTKGAHNNVQDGTRTLIVSSQQLTCVDRRSNKNDRTRPGLFACGGRAVGDGETTADQQFFSNKTAALSGGIGFTLVRDAVNSGVGPGNTCMSFDKDGFVRNTPCSPPNFTPEQTWIIGDSGAPLSVPVAQPSSGAAGKTTSIRATSTTAAAVTSPTAAPSPAATTSPEIFVLPKPHEGPGPLFDGTATRAATGAHIRNAGSPNICFDVSDFRTGDDRFNLVPIALKTCDASVDGQKFDLITKGIHNNVADGSRTIIVSSQQFTCIDRRSNRNDRTRPGLFACGGRAVGDGETTADQQYFFNKNINPSGGIGFPLVRDAVNDGIGPGNQCLTLNKDGFLSNTPCSPPNFSPDQTWLVGDLDGKAAPVTGTSSAQISTSAAVSTKSVVLGESSQCPSAAIVVVTQTVTVQPQAGQATTTDTLSPSILSISTTSATAAAPSSTADPGIFVLPAPKDGPGPTFDKTATRAATSAQIRSVAQPDICFDVSDFQAGDSRFNLVPLALKKCDSSVAGQKFDLITKGEHNNVPDGSRTLITSSQQFTCVDRRSNKNDRLRPGLFACGGRAAGDGETTADQQFFFGKAANLKAGIGFPLVRDARNNGIGAGNQCLTLNADGFVSNSPCSPPNFTPEQTWIVE